MWHRSWYKCSFWVSAAELMLFKLAVVLCARLQGDLQLARNHNHICVTIKCKLRRFEITWAEPATLSTPDSYGSRPWPGSSLEQGCVRLTSTVTQSSSSCSAKPSLASCKQCRHYNESSLTRKQTVFCCCVRYPSWVTAGKDWIFTFYNLFTENLQY